MVLSNSVVILIISIGIALLGQIQNIFNIVKRIFTRRILEGKWFAYHITMRESQEQFREGEWEFHRNIVNTTKVHVKYPDSRKTYRGKVVSHAGHKCINLTGVGFDEFVSIRLLPEWPSEDIKNGVWFGPDENGNLRTDFWFLSRKKMERNEAIRRIKDGERRVLGLNK